MPNLAGSSPEAVRRGAYVLRPPSADDPELVIVASGSEVQLSIAAAAGLDGVRTRRVSMPSWELFDEQPMEYR